jgi:hypothetical protein
MIWRNRDKIRSIIHDFYIIEKRQPTLPSESRCISIIE